MKENDIASILTTTRTIALVGARRQTRSPELSGNEISAGTGLPRHSGFTEGGR